MRILDVCPRVVHPPRRGAGIRTYNLLRHLSARHEVVQFSLPEDDPPALHRSGAYGLFTSPGVFVLMP